MGIKEKITEINSAIEEQEKAIAEAKAEIARLKKASKKLTAVETTLDSIFEEIGAQCKN